MAERVTQEVINATAVAGDWLQSCRPHIDGESPGGVGSILNQQHGQSALLCRLVFTWSTSTVYTVGAFIWANVTSLYDLILLFYWTKHVRVCHAFTGMSISGYKSLGYEKVAEHCHHYCQGKTCGLMTLIWGEYVLLFVCLMCMYLCLSVFCVCLCFLFEFLSNVYIKKGYLRGIIHLRLRTFSAKLKVVKKRSCSKNLKCMKQTYQTTDVTIDWKTEFVTLELYKIYNTTCPNLTFLEILLVKVQPFSVNSTLII